MNIRDRFVFNSEENILFIDFSALRIESREQVDEMRRVLDEMLEERATRCYGMVNYEGTEIVPEIMDYYGECIKELYDRYSLTTVRYSSSGLTRSVLRYLGAAKDLESNIFTTGEEALRAIQELKDRSRGGVKFSLLRMFSPRSSFLGKLWLGWVTLFLIVLAGYLYWGNLGEQFSGQFLFAAASLALLLGALISSIILYVDVIKPLRHTEDLARRLSIGGVIEPLKTASRNDEIGHLALAFNDAAAYLSHEIKRLSGLYHVSLMMGTGTDVSEICDLLTSKIARLLGAEMCVILLYNENENRIYAQFPAYGIDDDQLRTLRTGLEEKSIAAQVFKTGEPYLTNDALNDPLVNRAAAEAIGARELLAVPLKAGTRTLGTIEVINKPGGFLEEERRLVTIFASQAAQLLENARLFEQVILSERLAVVGELVAGVAHEVRNPLFGITTTLAALSRRLEDREELQPFLNVVTTEVERLNYLMEQLLEHSRPVNLDGGGSSLRAVVEEVLGEFALQAREKGVRLVVESPDAEVYPRIDRRKMHGVFTNLLENAMQHTDPGGRIELTLSANGKSAKDDGHEFSIKVSDTGTGISSENLHKVFEPFFTTRTNGIGLGLAIVRKTIHDHGGTITVNSGTKKGTEFVIKLPLENAKAAM